MSIGKRLEELIIYRGTNVNKVARAAEISPQTIYGIIKRDNTKVDINILMSLARQLDVTLDFFSGGEMSPERIEDETLLSKYRDLARPARGSCHHGSGAGARGQGRRGGGNTCRGAGNPAGCGRRGVSNEHCEAVLFLCIAHMV